MAKSVAWTEKLTAQLVAAYREGGKDNCKLYAIAKNLDRSSWSARAKLVLLGEYRRDPLVRPVK